LSDELINCITEFLTNRKFRVPNNGNFSRWFEVLSGIPQGSILLGPHYYYILTICQKSGMKYWQRYIFMQMMPNYISMFRTVKMLIFYSKKLKILKVGPTSGF